MSCPFTGTNIPTPLVKLSAKLDHFSQKGKKSLRIYSKTCRHKPMCQCRIFKSSGPWSYHLGARIQRPALAQLLQIEK